MIGPAGGACVTGGDVGSREPKIIDPEELVGLWGLAGFCGFVGGWGFVGFVGAVGSGLNVGAP